MKTLIFEVGFDKDGQADFGVTGTIGSLTYEQMKSLREMTVVGIGVFEMMWRDQQEKPKTEAIKP